MKNMIIIFSLFALMEQAVSSELVYTPINPSFGGNPMNGSILLNKANGQNTHSASSNERSYGDRLQESLERAYINKVVREVTDLAFGEQQLDENGVPVASIFDNNSLFVSGDFQVELITSNPDSLTVQITNILTGEITIVEIPRFG
ncbi:curli production assembly protein CsgF [Colwellia sp. MB02u-6]|uniref:curli assembly protein CsgF n=1 Tax=Colwellia sp. MB02u-6 TaxID=2759824 RepID=UPI0015F5A36B|nr:curli assembly protein CsgF [Colwellia sp. MB02u-6]MBA6327648.1 curli production assembly protein CsgF [Colwellia sp. MB02u-6]